MLKCILFKPCCYVIYLAIFCFSCQTKSLRTDPLIVLDYVKQKPLEGDWLMEHKESGQNFDAYCSSSPIRSTQECPYLYIVGMGEPSEQKLKILLTVQKGLSAFYQIPVRILADLPHHSMPQGHIRENGQWDAKWIIDKILPKHFPDSAMALIAFTEQDLYPGNDWNYVFGLASLKNRVGVWSYARFECECAGEIAEKMCYMRTLHVAIHETGHMFVIKHCIGFECCMNGSNSLFELDRQENRMCHECLAKVCWNRAISPGKHVQAMLEFYSDYLPDTSLISYYRSAQECLKKP